MTNDPDIINRKWLIRILAIPVLTVALIGIILWAESRKSVYPAVFTGELLSVRENALEVEGYGVVPLDAECSGFITFEGEWRPFADLFIGCRNLEFHTGDDAITEVCEKEKSSDLPVRVLIKDQDFANLFHEEITLICDARMTAGQNGSEYEIPAGEPVTFYADDEELEKGRVILTPEEGTGITVTSFSRADGHPEYPGRLEILSTDDGLALINELDMETYLTRVVPSEMGGYLEPEALKAQAVCARTYAYTQQRGNAYASYGAQLDDSTSFQVYNNVKEEERTTQAVYDTTGELIFYKGEPISAYYFSTSCGNTTDGSVWGLEPEDVPYLKSVALQPGRRTLDWSDEDEFETFIKRTDVNAYDSDSPYFRWNVTTDSRLLEQSHNDIGTITDARVTKRGAGGVALEMVLSGTEGEELVEGQYAIREALCDASLILNRQDGTGIDGFSALPSAFLFVEKTDVDEDGVTYFKVYGGGYGHGAGMSQNGASGMAKAGMGYEEILRFFYEGVTIESK